MFDLKFSKLPRKIKKKLYKQKLYDLRSILETLQISKDEFLHNDMRKLSKQFAKTYLKSKYVSKVRAYFVFAKASLLNESELPPKMTKKTLLWDVEIPKELTPVLDLETAIICAKTTSEGSVFEILKENTWLGQYPIYVSKRDFYKYPKLIRELKQNADFIFSNEKP